jgi:hypothetical protein
LRVIPDLTQQGLVDGEDYLVAKQEGEVIVGGMPEATASGNPGVMIAFGSFGPKDSEGFLVAETTLTLFLTAADALKARYGDPREGT